MFHVMLKMHTYTGFTAPLHEICFIFSLLPSVRARAPFESKIMDFIVFKYMHVLDGYKTVSARFPLSATVSKLNYRVTWTSGFSTRSKESVTFLFLALSLLKLHVRCVSVCAHKNNIQSTLLFI